MNKIVIPSLLLGVVMIAGAFAFMPVQEASTVHTTGNTVAAIGTDGIAAGDFDAGAIDAQAIAGDAITAAKIADDAILAVNIATDAIGALELADDVEPLSDVLTVSSADINAAGLNATCGAGGDAFLVHWVAVGANTDVLEIDLTDNAGAELSYTFVTAGAGLGNSGTVAGAAGATVEIAGDDDASAIGAIVTVQCTGNGVPAIT